MTAQLSFVSIEFLGIDEMDPPFSPQVKEYTIKRTAGTEFQFKVTVNNKPVPRSRDDWPYYDYPGFSMKYHESSAIYVSSWSPNNWYAVTCGPGTSSLSIYCETGPGYRGTEKLVGIYTSFTVITAPLSADAAKACTHTDTYTTEGQWWGGGSGSSCVEMLTKCSACGSVVSTSYDHRD